MFMTLLIETVGITLHRINRDGTQRTGYIYHLKLCYRTDRDFSLENLNSETLSFHSRFLKVLSPNHDNHVVCELTYT